MKMGKTNKCNIDGVEGALEYVLNSINDFT